MQKILRVCVCVCVCAQPEKKAAHACVKICKIVCDQHRTTTYAKLLRVRTITANKNAKNSTHACCVCGKYAKLFATRTAHTTYAKLFRANHKPLTQMQKILRTVRENMQNCLRPAPHNKICKIVTRANHNR